MPYEEEEIDEARRGEERRGKRPVDISARKRRLFLKQRLAEAMRSSDVELFKEMLINDLGWMPGTTEYEQALKLWYSQRGRR
jgi:hypothetical protein